LLLLLLLLLGTYDRERERGAHAGSEHFKILNNVEAELGNSNNAMTWSNSVDMGLGLLGVLTYTSDELYILVS
jgi:hypothetical protein